MDLLYSTYLKLRKASNILGYNIAISKVVKTYGSYESILVNATYAPWLKDTKFNNIYKKIIPYTLVDKYRCYELWDLISQVKDLKGALIEVGVWKGGTGAIIAQKAKIEGIKDKVYLCDTFSGVVKTGANDPIYKGGEHADTSRELVSDLMKSLKLSNVKLLSGIFPDETSKYISKEKFRFCHIDVDVYQSAKEITDWIWPRLVRGGIIAYDDYGFRGCHGVTKFINEEKNKTDRVILYNVNGHAIIIKL